MRIQFRLALALAMAGSFISSAGPAGAEWHTELQFDPIRAYGHGIAVDLAGNEIVFTPEKVTRFQQHYLDRAWQRLQSDSNEDHSSTRALLEGMLSEDGLSVERSRYWLLAWMIKVGYADDPASQMRLHLRNGLLDRIVSPNSTSQDLSSRT